MKLYKLSRDVDWDYDEHDGAVIRAANEDEARQIAERNLHPKGKGLWLDAKRVTCEEVRYSGPPVVVLESFMAR